MTAYFVIGTDTGVGKTTVAAALLASARRRGLRAAALKPVETGCDRGNGELFASDGARLAAAANAGQAVADVVTYRFAPPVAPAVAARRAGVIIDFDRIAAAVATTRQRKPDLLLVEGAGGLLVPLGFNRTMADLALVLGMPLLVIARAALGTINHTLLTVEVARARGLAVAGVVLCATQPLPLGAAAGNGQENGEEIAAALGPRIPLFGQLEHVPDGGDLAAAAERGLDLGALLSRAAVRR